MLQRAARFPLSRIAGLLAATAWAVSARRNRYRRLHDSLTGLPNRTLLTDELASLPVGGSHGHPTLLCARVDDLVAINHAYGRAGRNRVLQEVAGRISAVLGPSATLARSSDDEFTAIVAGLADEQRAERLARQVQRALVDPIDLGGARVTVPVSIGIARARSAEDRTSLLRNGDLALEAARRSGRGACATYKPSMLEDVQARWRLEVELAEAFERRQLTVWYQPIVDIRSGHMTGVEALVRWQHPERGVVGPDDFVPAVAETGRLPDLTRFVLGEACAWARSWQAKFPDEPPLSVAVNVSPRDLVTSEVVDDVTLLGSIRLSSCST